MPLVGHGLKIHGDLFGNCIIKVALRRTYSGSETDPVVDANASSYQGQHCHCHCQYDYAKAHQASSDCCSGFTVASYEYT